MVGKLRAEIVVSNNCNLCGKCVNLCVTHVYEIVGSKLSLNKELCIGCKACEVLCPQKAIKVFIVDDGLTIMKYRPL